MEGIEALMKHIYLFPIVGLALGLILGASTYVLIQIFPVIVVSALALVMIYKLCGINHLDGLADFGDGLTAHGTVEKKINAMKDVYLGTGGAFFMVAVLLLIFASLTSLPVKILPLVLVVSEVSAKQSMIAFSAFSKPLHKGFGQITIENTSKSDFIIGLIISLLICALCLGLLGVAMLILAQLSALYLIIVSNRNFGGSTGDGLGASNEIGRAAAMLLSVALWEVLTWMPW
jgi:adenosylcobinamide-GDP ribazoletransferase